jgi:alkylation response protein AidB-like acyl-CoA dehydrogenase
LVTIGAGTVPTADDDGGRRVSASPIGREDLDRRVEEFLAAHDPAALDPLDFLRARFDAGLAWLGYPEGLGGIGGSRDLQRALDARFAAAGAPSNHPEKIGIGLGMAAPTILRFGTPEQHRRWLKKLWTGEEVWCQLFSEPGAGSDLAGLATRAVRDGDEWVVDGQKVWTSMAHIARWAILLTRTDPDVPKHRGMTYFVLDMTAPGVEVRPLRQATGEAEFNEVFLSGVRIPDAYRLGEVGEGWNVARTTLMNERVAIGGSVSLAREGGPVARLANLWRDRPDLRRPGIHDEVMAAWVQAEAVRLTADRFRQQLAAGHPGPEGASMKLAFATLNQQVTSLVLEVLGEEGLAYDDYTMRRPESVDFVGRAPGYNYLRSKGNSIEGGTSEVLLNIIAERVLGLPGEPRVDKDVAWKDLPK